MVFRDYKVRCKKCKIPYHPDNVSRIRTCVFCRTSNVEDRSERLKVLVDDIKTYSETQGLLPTKEIVETWIRLKFGVSDSTIYSYLKELEEMGLIAFVQKDNNIRIKLLNLVQQPVNS